MTDKKPHHEKPPYSHDKGLLENYVEQAYKRCMQRCPHDILDEVGRVKPDRQADYDRFEKKCRAMADNVKT